MTANSFLAEAIADAKTIGISGHVRPDGDCVGSCMALGHYLNQCYPHLKVQVYLDEITDTFSYLHTLCDVFEMKNKKPQSQIYDVFISLDCGDQSRLGDALALFESAKRTVNIDHHISNTFFGMTNQVEPNASSTCEVLCGLMEEDGIDLPCANALYTGLVHDTGVFKHNNTSKRTMQFAGMLIAKGVPFTKIIEESFFQKTYIQNQLLGRCLLESVSVMDGKCLFCAVSIHTLEFYHACPSDLDGVIDQMRVTKGVEVAILLYEIGFHEHKVSLRSNQCIDVSRIATGFGGGGHIRAAGCTMRGSVHDVVNSITEQVEIQMLSQND